MSHAITSCEQAHQGAEGKAQKAQKAQRAGVATRYTIEHGTGAWRGGLLVVMDLKSIDH